MKAKNYYVQNVRKSKNYYVQNMRKGKESLRARCA